MKAAGKEEIDPVKVRVLVSTAGYDEGETYEVPPQIADEMIAANLAEEA